jgi:TetR/AcrR family transcriptional repressor of mexJK operon
MTAEEGRSARKRKVIMEAATSAFLGQGYLGTSMDEIAAQAAVSKQTVYKHFSDKKRLFTDIVTDTTGSVDDRLKSAALALRDTDDLERDLRALAGQLVNSILAPQVLQLRRLIIAEVGRFPEVGRSYWEEGFERGLRTIALVFEELVQKGQLRMDDPILAAHQFAGLILWVPVNKVMFCGEADGLTAAEVDRYADNAVRVFLAAYGV